MEDGESIVKGEAVLLHASPLLVVSYARGYTYHIAKTVIAEK